MHLNVRRVHLPTININGKTPSSSRRPLFTATAYSRRYRASLVVWEHEILLVSCKGCGLQALCLPEAGRACVISCGWLQCAACSWCHGFHLNSRCHHAHSHKNKWCVRTRKEACANKYYAPNSKVRVITKVYGMHKHLINHISVWKDRPI